MAKEAGSVPYGFTEDGGEGTKGTLIVYDSFEEWGQAEIARIAAAAESKRFSLVVWYPLHEETVKRMGTGPVRPYQARHRELEEEVEQLDTSVRHTIEQWDGRRKKYTPIDTSLRFMAEKYNAPLFICMTSRTARLFAGYSVFDEWIRKVRLLILPLGESAAQLHPKLDKAANRWEFI
jgi:hypothetical protein